jgi:hypothetical protein
VTTDFETKEFDTNEYEVTEFLAYGKDGVARTIVKAVSIHLKHTKKGIVRVPGQIRFYASNGNQAFEVEPGVFKLKENGKFVTLVASDQSQGDNKK